MNKRPRLIEMVGVAGVGKSTLRKALRQRNEAIQAVLPPPKPHYLPFLREVALGWWPLYIKNYRHSRWFTGGELRNMGYLDTWIPYIRTQTLVKNLIIVLDPGSIYWLSDLQEFGPEVTRHPRFQNWWDRKFEQWSAALDVIVWLDAPEDLCLQRVLAREEWHDAKLQSSTQAIGEFRRFRKCYEQFIAKMAAHRPIKVFRFQTDQISTEQIMDQICSEVDLTPFKPNSP